MVFLRPEIKICKDNAFALRNDETFRVHNPAKMNLDYSSAVEQSANNRFVTGANPVNPSKKLKVQVLRGKVARVKLNQGSGRKEVRLTSMATAGENVRGKVSFCLHQRTSPASRAGGKSF